MEVPYSRVVSTPGSTADDVTFTDSDLVSGSSICSVLYRCDLPTVRSKPLYYQDVGRMHDTVAVSR